MIATAALNMIRLALRRQRRGRVLVLAMIALNVLSACNINEKQDRIDEWLEWSNFWYSQGDDRRSYERSKFLAEKVLEEKPDDIMAQNILGFSMLKVGPWDSDNPYERTARKVFEDTLKREPENYRAHLGLGLCNYKLSKVRDRGYLDDFARAMVGTQNLLKLIANYRALDSDKEPQKVTDAEVRMVTVFADYSDDLRKFVTRDVFPLSRYEALVPVDQRRANAKPQRFEIKAAIQARIADLLKACETALRSLPLDTATLAANLDRVNTLLNVAYEHYRDRYRAQLQLALEQFLACERMHEKHGREYHWVYEYIGLVYLLQATTELTPGAPRPAAGVFNTVTTEEDAVLIAQRRDLLAKSRRYLDRFIKADLRFETARLKKIGDKNIAELESNPYWTLPIQDYRELMRELIDDARRHRQSVIEVIIHLDLDELNDFEGALRWCDTLAEAEVLFSDPRELGLQAIKHHYYRAEAYRRHGLALEQNAKRDKHGELVLSDSVKAEHRGWWLDSYREYNKFLQRAPLVELKTMRAMALEAKAQALERYPEFSTLPERD